MVIVHFAEVIQLTEVYYAPGSRGSFNLQVAVTVVNNQAEAWNAGNWELFIVPMNSGIFVNESGANSDYTALLAKQDVLKTSVQEHYRHGTVNRMIGGGFLNSLQSAMGWVSSELPYVRNTLSKTQHPYALATTCSRPWATASPAAPISWRTASRAPCKNNYV